MATILRHLNRLVLSRGYVISYNFRRRFADYISPNELICGKLPRRGLLQVMGTEASGFLQGLVTNDMRHFDEHSSVLDGSGTGRSTISVSGMKKSMYSMILNVNGQILFDLIIYNLKSSDEKLSTNFILECDHAGLPDLAKLLAKYRLRKEIEINDVTDQFNVWIATTYSQNENVPPEKQLDVIVPEPVVIEPGHVTCMTRDPRTPALGWRLLLPRDINPEIVLKYTCIIPNIQEKYVNLRHKLGVWEGVDDIPPSECYPLECNADYMHGVSFHKGCYVGQELTARSHHTGVIRKRIMPIIFDVDDPTPISKWTIIENELGRSVGRFISKLGRYGIAQIRMQECFASSRIQIKGHNGKIVTFRPHWWPLEQKKEQIVIGRERDG